MHLDEVRTALASEAEHVPPAALDAPATLRRVTRRARRRRNARRTASAAVALTVVAGVALLAARSTGDEPTVRSGRPTARGAPRLPAPPTPRQLAAHLGTGVPDGWAPVDFGDARLFAPPDWLVERDGECVGGTSIAGMVGVGRVAQRGCTPTDQFPLPPDAVSLTTGGSPAKGQRPARTVEGYHLYEASGSSGSTDYLVPALGVRITVHGDLGDRVLATLAPSTARVALGSLRRVRPAGDAVSAGGIRAVVPSSWGQRTADSFLCNWPGFSASRPEVLVLRPDGAVAPSCPAASDSVGNEQTDGLLVDESKGRSAAPSTWPMAPTEARTVAVLHHRFSTVRVLAPADSGRFFVLVVRRAGSTRHHFVVLGLGADGRVAAGILASVEATG